VTEVKPLEAFYPAEEYHRDYFRRNPNQGYCRAVIAPKVAKIRKLYFDKLKQTGGLSRPYRRAQALPTNVIGLLFHLAEHTQRHAGQVITTTKIVRALGHPHD